MEEQPMPPNKVRRKMQIMQAVEGVTNFLTMHDLKENLSEC